jgi:uncharacterized protein (DUF736 family)
MATDDKTPDYIVSAGIRGEKKSYVRVGIAYNSRSGKGNNYISIRLHARPWDGWDGTLYLHENTNRQPGEEDIPV